MDVSGEAADLVVKESLQATETAAKLLGGGIKGVAALLLAVRRGDLKVTGKTNADKLARDPSPALVMPLRREDIPRFRALAKQYGVLYFFAQPKGQEGPMVDMITTQNYSPQVTAVYQAMGYPLPEQKEEAQAKKAEARAPRENSSSERGNGSTPSQTRDTDAVQPEAGGENASVRAHLEMLRAASKRVRQSPERDQEKTR